MSERVGAAETGFWADENENVALERYQTLVNTLNDGLYQLDPDGNFVAVNDVIVEETGYAREELLGEHVSLILDDADIDRVEREIRTLLERNRDDVSTLELPVRTADGDTLFCELRLSILENDGEFCGTVGVARDVTDRKQRERTLERERELLDRVFEASPIGIAALAPDGEVVTQNKHALEIVGADPTDPEEVYDALDWDVYDADGEPIPPEERAFGQVVETGEPVTDFEAQVERRDGGRVWLSFNGFPIFDADDDLSLVVLTYKDITKLKEREQHLQRERAQTEKLLRTAPVAIAVQNTDGKTVMANQRAQEALGLSRQEIIEEPENADEWTVYDADGEPLADDETPSARVLATGEPKFDEVIAIEPPDDERIWFRINAAPIVGPDGTIERVITAGEDITELKQREQQLERRKTELETELSEILGRISDAFYALDEEFRFQHVNERAEEILQHAEADLLGRSIWEVFPEVAQGSVFREEFQQARDTQEPTSFEYYTGEFDAWLEFNVYPSETGLSVYFQDVTERKVYERALEESEWRYRTLVENFPNGAVGLFDENLEYTAIGGELVKATGVAPENRIGNSVYDIYPDEIVEEVEPYFQAALAGEANAFETEYHDRNLFAHTLPVENDDGEVFAGMLVVQDVTKRREAQQELRESEAKFRMLAENLEEIVWMATADADEFIYVNPPFEEVWGIDRDTLYDEPLSFLDAVHEDDRERVRSAFTRLPEDEFDEEYRIVRPDGEVRWIHSRGSRVEDDDGEMVRVVGIGEDITERVERERELERALDLLDKTERIADVGGWEIDVETTDVFWTDHIFDLLEVNDDEEPPLEEALDMYHEEDQPIVERAIEQALASGDPFDVEVRLRTAASDEVRWLRLQGVPETVDGEVVSFRGAAQDVTERKQREQRLEELVGRLEESNERLEQFAYAASHDLQEPLRMVSSYLRLIEQRYADALDEDGEEFLEFAVDGADRMRSMIEGLLQYSRVETQGDKFEPVDLESLLEDARENLQMKIVESDAEITADSLPHVEGDEGQLRQVFQNLLDNAIEYSGDEPPRVHVSAERNGAEWTVSVADEGIGIAPDDQEYVFEVFQRVHGNRESSGTGIGLALCERIIERHDGDIWVESELGEGATFSFTLPAVGGGVR